ncbi:rod shape-determining protein MreD [Flocculibacter collagenilyticus]|uniref:rod shape-determining protein MreD n=1 Tax=Flocculibacter collagenilyticus TaxID=2744479 RepID=UPI0018F3DC9B|nr:rod shape-determining protein MreD [Flocculibacter collagenilyticus]
MVTKRSNSPLFISFTLLLSLVLAIMPMPLAFEYFRPDWPLLVIMYWSIALPNRVNIGVAWLAGFILDLLLGTVLGIHAVTFAIISYITASNYQKIRNFSVWQQAIIIGLFLALYHLLVFWLSHFLTDVFFIPQYMWPVLTGTLAWPWVFLLLRKYRRQFKVR